MASTLQTIEGRNTAMTQVQTSFDALLATAHDLAITVVAGQLGPPIDGSMWLGDRSLDSIL